MKKLFFCSVTLVAALAGSVVEARSPRGTPEYAAEDVAISKMRDHWGGWQVQDAQMRSNRLSIALPSVNRTSRKQGQFKVDVQRRTRRDGSYYYEVGIPQAPQ